MEGSAEDASSAKHPRKFRPKHARKQQQPGDDKKREAAARTEEKRGEESGDSKQTSAGMMTDARSARSRENTASIGGDLARPQQPRKRQGRREKEANSAAKEEAFGGNERKQSGEQAEGPDSRVAAAESGGERRQQRRGRSKRRQREGEAAERAEQQGEDGGKGRGRGRRGSRQRPAQEEEQEEKKPHAEARRHHRGRDRDRDGLHHQQHQQPPRQRQEQQVPQGEDDKPRKPRRGRGGSRRRRPNDDETANKNEEKTAEGGNASTARLRAEPRGNRRALRRVYKDYMDEAEVRALLEQGLLYKGVLRVNGKNRRHAYVTCQGLRVDVKIEGDADRNRAIHGDTVAVELYPVNEWCEANKHALAERLGQQSAEDTRRREEEESKQAPQTTALWQPRVTKEMFHAIGTEPRSPADLTEVERFCWHGHVQPRGKVVYIFDKSHSVSVIGALELPAGVVVQKGQPLPPSIGHVMFKSHDTRFPDCIANRSELPFNFISDPSSMLHMIFKATVKEDWKLTSKMPHAIGIHALGEMGSIQAETDALLQQFDVDHGLFPDAVMDSLREVLPSIPADADPSISHLEWQIPPEEFEKRRDLRDHRIFTIDPSTAKDLDDAVHVKRLGDDIVEVGVHIADVSFFVRPSTALDEEARRRATTVYLVQKVIPMLPPLLSEQLCSLNPNVDRLAYSVIWKMRLDGTLVAEPAWFGRTIIRSCAKLDYDTAQRMIEGEITPDMSETQISEDMWQTNRRPVGHSWRDVVSDVLLMHTIAKARRKTRLESGALVLNRVKTVFKLDIDGNPTLAQPYPIKDSNKLIEEYMLLANYLVAEEMIVKLGKPAFLRQHPPPSSKGLEELKVLAEAANLPIDTTTASTLQASLNRIAREADPLVIQAVTALLAKPMNTALYFVAGSKPSTEWRHYALAIPYYTHFTSPIRRYADIIVHRMLSLGLIDSDQRHSQQSLLEFVGATEGDLEAVAEHCNTKKKAAKDAQERSDRVFLSVFVQRLPAGYMDEPAVVIGVGEKSFTVLITRLGMECRIYMEDMPDLVSAYDEKTHTLTITTAPKNVAQNADGEQQGNGRGKGNRRNGKGDGKGDGKGNKQQQQQQMISVDRLAEDMSRLALHDRATFDAFPLTIFTPVVVRMYPRTRPPVDLRVTLLSPQTA